MIVCAAAPAAAADYFDLSPEQLLGAEIMSVSKRTETVAAAPAAVYVITGEDIARSGVTTIPDALRMAPGVEVARADSNSWAVSIRGFNSVLANKLLVLIDGRTIYNPVFGGVMWEAHDLMLADIDRIEVVRGPGGTLWGANAVNGVINIITKKAGDTQGNLVSVLAGNEETGTVSARHGGAFGPDGRYRVYAKAFDRDSSRRPEGGDTYDDWHGRRGGFRADWGPRFTLQGDVYRVDTLQKRTQFFIAAPAVNVNQTLDYRGVNLLGRWTDTLPDGSQLSVQSYVDWARRDEPVNFVDNRVIYDVETQYNLAPLGSHEVIMGAGYRFSGDHQTGGGRDVSFDPQGRRDSIYSAFLQDKMTVVPERLFLTLGSKVERNPYSGLEVQPSARLQYHPDAQRTAWAAVSRAVRTPTPIETDLTSTIAAGGGARFAFVPNNNFRSEELTAYELGYREQVTPEFSVDLASFFNRYNRLQTTAVLPFFQVINGIDPPHLFVPVEFRNDMQATAWGFEAAASWTARPNLKLTGNVSLMKLTASARTRTQEAAVEDSYPGDMAGLRATWNINESWTLDPSLSYAGNVGAGAVDSYVRADVNLGWQPRPGVRLNLVGQNLLSDVHRENGAANGLNAGVVERGMFGKVTCEF